MGLRCVLGILWVHVMSDDCCMVCSHARLCVCGMYGQGLGAGVCMGPGQPYSLPLCIVKIFPCLCACVLCVEDLGGLSCGISSWECLMTGFVLHVSESVCG